MIGTERESSLHRALKFRYSGDGGETEALTGDFICDARTSDGEFIEVQTGSFGPLKEKVKTLTRTGKVRIIHPIIVRKEIELYDTEGKLLRRRTSPKKGCCWDLFRALLYAPDLPLFKNLTVELALVDVLEKRVADSKGSWRRKGVSINDRFLSAWHEGIILSKPKDYNRFIPFTKKERFTVRNLSEKTGIDTSLAGKCLYVLNKMGLVERVGKKGNSLIYKTT
ncbi:MAG: hypothetical protein LBC62_04850 [Treponema sp.]|jgi:hypothetical protein|nr:hypothetical protein [Treponema sp.]